MCHSPKKFHQKVGVDRDRESKKLGKKGERKAARYLKIKGWKIVKKNYVNPFGEIDIIASKQNVLAFIEVKTRSSDKFGTPSQAVNESKKSKYVQGAKFFFYKREMNCAVRFDIIEVYQGQINHIENAFYPN